MNYMFNMIYISAITVLSLTVCLTFHKDIFKFTALFWSRLRNLFYYNKTLFDIFFLMVYFIEQATLLYFISENPKSAHIFAGIFALIFMTTISFEKIAMESRYRFFKEHASKVEIERDETARQFTNIIEVNKTLQQALEKQIKSDKR